MDLLAYLNLAVTLAPLQSAQNNAKNEAGARSPSTHRSPYHCKPHEKERANHHRDIL